MGTGGALSLSPAAWSPQAWGGLGFEAGDQEAEEGKRPAPKEGLKSIPEEPGNEDGAVEMIPLGFSSGQ